MKFPVVLMILMSCQCYAQQPTKTVNIGEAKTVNIQNGKVTIGKIIINEEANKAKIYLDTIVEIKDSFSLWHYIVTFDSKETNPIYSAFLSFEFNNPIINIFATTQSVASTGLDSTKKKYSFFSTNVQRRPLRFIINSEKRIKINLYGVLGKSDH